MSYCIESKSHILQMIKRSNVILGYNGIIIPLSVIMNSTLKKKLKICHAIQQGSPLSHFSRQLNQKLLDISAHYQIFSDLYLFDLQRFERLLPSRGASRRSY